MQPIHTSFRTTRWSIIDDLRSDDPAHRDAAIRNLLDIYRPAFEHFFRVLGQSADEAEDLTQGFVTEKVLSNNLFQKADPQRARLRQLIKEALRNYSIDRLRREQRHRRQLSLDHPASDKDALEDDDARALTEFDRFWTSQLLQKSLALCEMYYTGTQRHACWRAFELRVLHPVVYGTSPPALADIAQQLEMESEITARDAVYHVRKRLRYEIQRQVAATVDHPDDIQEEFACVKQYMGV